MAFEFLESLRETTASARTEYDQVTAERIQEIRLEEQRVRDAHKIAAQERAEKLKGKEIDRLTGKLQRAAQQMKGAVNEKWVTYDQPGRPARLTQDFANDWAMGEAVTEHFRGQGLAAEVVAAHHTVVVDGHHKIVGMAVEVEISWEPVNTVN